MRRSKTRLLHAERRKNMFRRILIERLAREPLHQRSQHNEVDIAINKRRAWSPFWSPLKRRTTRRPIRSNLETLRGRRPHQDPKTGPTNHVNRRQRRGALATHEYVRVPVSVT